MNINNIGRLANELPYSVIPFIGAIYNSYQKEIANYNTTNNKREYIFRRVYSIVKYAIENTKFYREFYSANGFSIEQLKTFDDIQRIPIINKEILMNTPLDEWSNNIWLKRRVNTGGSTGKPLQFYQPLRNKIKEAAYYHMAWEKLGYKKSEVRLQFVGRKKARGIKYELARNEFQVSVYEKFDTILEELARFNSHDNIKYLQGYPSVIYEFALYCSIHQTEYDRSRLKKSLKGIFLNSEYPHPMYVNTIEAVFGVKSIASYGHTEQVCLAFDFGDGYQVSQSYGFSESVEMSDGKHLIGTTYDNYASPLIRYDTNDLMDSITCKDGILQSFLMTNGGRNCQYIVDKFGKNISLTGLIFGKHHKLFNYCSQLQVSQNIKGEATIYYVPLNEFQEHIAPEELFDAKDIAIDFRFKKIPEAIKTKNGKVLLLVKK